MCKKRKSFLLLITYKTDKTYFFPLIYGTQKLFKELMVKILDNVCKWQQSKWIYKIK